MQEQNHNEDNSFNPKFKDFLEKNPNITIYGVWWSLTWRGLIVGFAITLVIRILFGGGY